MRKYTLASICFVVLCAAFYLAIGAVAERASDDRQQPTWGGATQKKEASGRKADKTAVHTDAEATNGVALNRLAQKVRADGTVRLIVRLRADFQPEGDVVKGMTVVSDNAREVQAQRRGIQAAQQDLFDNLNERGLRFGEIKRFEFIPFVAFEADAQTFEYLRNAPEVAFIQEDNLKRPTLAQSTQQMGAQAAWAAGFTGSGQTVAILDTGVDRNHPFLAGKVVSEACYSTTRSTRSTSVCPGGAAESTADGSGVPMPSNVAGYFHGTHVAGIAAGRNGTSGGNTFSGVAKDANIIAIQVFSRFGANDASAYTSDIIKGLERVYALRNTYSIASVNMSLGGDSFISSCDVSDQATKAVVDNLRAVSIATVIASGNDGFPDAVGSPACISTAISVGATGDTNDNLAIYSNNSALVNLLAPGSSITSSVPGGGYGTISGTSMATPHVAGAWAILKQKQPTASVAQVLSALSDTGVPVSSTFNTTRQRIQVDAALNAVSSTQCAYAISPIYSILNDNAQSGTARVEATGGCAWTAVATSNGGWLSITSGINGTGDGTINYTAAANTSAIQRTATITVAGQTLLIVQKPASSSNDNFANAQTLQGCSGLVFGDNLQATKEAGEPNHAANNAGGKSVWYRWTATTTGQIIVSTRNSVNRVPRPSGDDRFDTLLGVYTGTAVNALTKVTKRVIEMGVEKDVPVENDDEDNAGGIISSLVSFTATAGTTYYFAVDGYDGDDGDIVLRWNQAVCQGQGIQFAQSTQTVSEATRVAQVNVIRTGNTSGAASVEYTTLDYPALFNCRPDTTGQQNGAIRGIATARCDYSTTVGTLQFAAGETSKTFDVTLINDAHVEGSERFSIFLRNVQNGTLGDRAATVVLIQDDDQASQANPLNEADNRFFVRQQYIDFFGRNPSDPEITTWTNVLQPNNCGIANLNDVPDNCYDRIWVSGKGFFESQEFQQKGYYVYRFYKLLGRDRLPTYQEFIPDMVSITDTSETQKNTYALKFTQRADYQAIYGALDNNAFVDTLIQRTGLTTLNAAQMKADLNSGAKDRWLVLREVAESAELTQREFREAYVVMQYFGYLRRDGAPSEYQGWIDYLNANPTKWRQMVNGFLNSTEYRQRFGQP